MKLLILCLMLLQTIHAQKVTFQCEFEDYFATGSLERNLYKCNANLPKVSIRNLIATLSKPRHQIAKRNSDVEAFEVKNQREVHHMPHGIEKIFKNLKWMSFESSGLKSVRQSDLEPFDQLEYLSLKGNQIQSLEENLFKANSKLKFLNFDDNQIAFIGLRVFNSLSGKKFIYLSRNRCISKSANSFVDINNLIDEVEEKCSDQKVLAQAEAKELKEEVSSLEAALTSRDDEIQQKDKKFTKEIKDLKLENDELQKISSDYEKLKSEAEIFQIANEAEIKKLKDQIVELENELKNVKIDKKRLQTEISNVTEKFNANYVKCRMIMMTNEKLKKEKEEIQRSKDSEIKIIKDKFEGQKSNHENEMKLKDQELEEFKQKNLNLKKEIQSFKDAELNPVKDENDQIKKQLSDLERNCKLKDQELKDVKQENSNLETEISKSKALNHQLNNLKQNLTSKDQEIEALKNEMQIMTDKMNQLESDKLTTISMSDDELELEIVQGNRLTQDESNFEMISIFIVIPNVALGLSILSVVLMIFYCGVNQDESAECVNIPSAPKYENENSKDFGSDYAEI